MFSIFKAKPVLKDLIPNGTVDIHSHVLHGLDDGAKSIDDTTFLLESMKEIGFSKVITTPHTTPLVWDNTYDGIVSKLTEVKDQIPELSNSVSLHAASEYLMDGSFLERLQSEKLLTLKDNIVLVEMSYINPPIQLYDILFKLVSKGYVPILAHPERYNFYKRDFESFKKLKKAGCLFQLNLLSVTGYYGKDISEVAEYLLKNDMYDFVGSDIHHEKHIKGFYSKVIVKNYNQIQKIAENNNLTF